MIASVHSGRKTLVWTQRHIFPLLLILLSLFLLKKKSMTFAFRYLIMQENESLAKVQSGWIFSYVLFKFRLEDYPTLTLFLLITPTVRLPAFFSLHPFQLVRCVDMFRVPIIVVMLTLSVNTESFSLLFLLLWRHPCFLDWFLFVDFRNTSPFLSLLTLCLKRVKIHMHCCYCWVGSFFCLFFSKNNI